MRFGIGFMPQRVKRVFATGLCVVFYRTIRTFRTGLFADRETLLPDYACIATELCVKQVLTA